MTRSALLNPLQTQRTSLIVVHPIEANRIKSVETTPSAAVLIPPYHTCDTARLAVAVPVSDY